MNVIMEPSEPFWLDFKPMGNQNGKQARLNMNILVVMRKI